MGVVSSVYLTPVTLDQLRSKFDQMCALDPWKVSPNPMLSSVQRYFTKVVEMTKLLLEFCLTERGCQVRRGTTIAELSGAAAQFKVYVAPYCHQHAVFLDAYVRGEVDLSQVHPNVVRQISSATMAFYNEIATYHKQ